MTRTPPHDLDAERALLGGMLLGTGPVLAAVETVTSADFYSPAHATIFSALAYLHANGHPVEIIGAAAELDRRGVTEQVGGKVTLLDLQAACPAPSAAPRYAAMVADTSRLRRLIVAADLIAEVAYNGSDAGEAVEQAHLAVGRVDDRPRDTGLRVLTRAELDAIPPPEWLIDGIATTGFTVLFGPSGTGKSFCALDWACSVATGTAWFGRAVLPRRVLYVAAEGTSGIPRRVQAWEQDRRHRAVDLALVPQVVNLLNPTAVASLAAEVTNRDVGLLVVDTLARSMPGGDENAAQDMGRLVHSLTEIQSRSRCAVLLVHHSGVEKSRMRGSTSLFGAADTVVKCEGENGLMFISCDKQKDDDPFHPWHLRMKPVAGSVALTLAGGARADDALARLQSELADGRGLPYLDVIRLAGGDGQVVLRLVETGRLVRCDGDDKLYTLAEHPQLAHAHPEF